MTADVVNLRRARKAKARDDQAREAQANRVAHGTPRHRREEAQALRDLETRRLDGHRRVDHPVRDPSDAP